MTFTEQLLEVVLAGLTALLIAAVVFTFIIWGLPYLLGWIISLFERKQQ